jgi:hypothetical protein
MRDFLCQKDVIDEWKLISVMRLAAFFIANK